MSGLKALKEARILPHRIPVKFLKNGTNEAPLFRCYSINIRMEKYAKQTEHICKNFA